MTTQHPRHMYRETKRIKEVNGMPSQSVHSLITQTPEEGFALAVMLAQKGVTVTQPSEEVRKVLRPAYSTNPDSLINVSQVIAVHFQTVAAANNYWRQWTPYYQ
ncbi:hypothetical protein ABID49_001503 [Bhargavaea ullalensis]|uniref:Hexameric tyrosine-coordinated heme protein (HTHP) n=2 Tax=Bhargavaea ullalensis TaxID=1265685 RepID=A0ABV2GBH1_9BACL